MSDPVFLTFEKGYIFRRLKPDPDFFFSEVGSGSERLDPDPDHLHPDPQRSLEDSAGARQATTTTTPSLANIHEFGTRFRYYGPVYIILGLFLKNIITGDN